MSYLKWIQIQFGQQDNSRIETQYPGSVVPLAMFVMNIDDLVNNCHNSTPLASKVHCSINGLENSSSPEYSKVQHLFRVAVGLFPLELDFFPLELDLEKVLLRPKKRPPLIEKKSPPLTQKSPTLTKKVLLEKVPLRPKKVLLRPKKVLL